MHNIQTTRMSWQDKRDAEKAYENTGTAIMVGGVAVLMAIAISIAAKSGSQSGEATHSLREGVVTTLPAQVLTQHIPSPVRDLSELNLADLETFIAPARQH